MPVLNESALCPRWSCRPWHKTVLRSSMQQRSCVETERFVNSEPPKPTEPPKSPNNEIVQKIGKKWGV
eukprot:1658944-Amphidinium_carterae.1